MKKYHQFITLGLIVTLIFQGLLLSLKSYGIPVWGFFLFLFVPFYFHYLKFILNINNVIIRRNYFFVLALVVITTIINLYVVPLNAYSAPQITVIPCGLLVLSVIFYDFRYRPYRFILIFCILILIVSIVSVIQFHFDFDFFEDYRRKTTEIFFDGRFAVGPLERANGTLTETNWDAGSSGTFGFPVPFGYFIATFIPIVFPFIISFYKTKKFWYKTVLIFLVIFCYYGLILSEQRAAIITSTTSIGILLIYLLGYKKSMFLIFVITPAFFFSPLFPSLDKELLSISDIIERVVDQYYWLSYDGEYLASIGRSSQSPHLYFFNLYSSYGLIVTLFILLFYGRLISMLFKFSKYRYPYLPIGTFMGAILSVISYNIVALFHNNGHFQLDIVGFISLGYIFLICNVVAKSNPPNPTNI